MKIPLSLQAYEQIKTDILTCTLQPGQQIAQNQLSEEYDLGITPVREALQRLSQEGYVQPIPRFGYIVAPITVSDLYEIYEMRAIIEPAAARLAAMRCTDAQLEQICRLADKTYTYTERDTYLQYLNYNVEFHYTVALAGANRRLAETVAKLLEELTRAFHMGLERRDLTIEMGEAHIPLIDALSKRDPDGAEAVMKSQIARSRIYFFDSLKNHDVDNQAVEIRLPS
jgi:DNA-binding GntR family transcriptional regulator